MRERTIQEIRSDQVRQLARLAEIRQQAIDARRNQQKKRPIHHKPRSTDLSAYEQIIRSLGDRVTT